MGLNIQTIVLTLFALLLTVDPVAAYGYYYNSWYIYVIIVFVIVAISSCIGACVRHRRNQMFLEQQRQLMSQGITIQTANGATNQGYYPSYGQQGGQYPTPPPPGGLIQQPPPYGSTAANTQEKDPNMPPAYEDAVNAPHMPDGPPTSAGNPAYAPPSDNSTAPYPTQPAPYPTQPAPYPVQQTPYPPQQQTPYPPPSNDNQQPAAYPPPAAGAPQY